MNSRQLNRALLAINVGLLGIIVMLFFWMKDRQPGNSESGRLKVIENTVTQRQVLKINPTNLLDELTKRRIGWQAIESTNYLFYIHNLRSIGCPEETIRDIILTDIAKLFTRRQSQLLAQAPPFEYWRTVPEGEDELLNRELQQQLDQLEADRDQLVKNLLGVDFDTEISKYLGETAVRERLFAFLSPEKRSLVLALLSTFDTMERQVYQRSGGILLPADENQLRALERQKQAELAKILSPEELTLYELNLSPLATELRYDLYGFEPSAEEFATVFRLRKTMEQVVDSSMEDNPGLNPEAREQAVQAAQAALDSELEKVLGEERFAQYARAQDPDYQFLLKWTERMQLPTELAAQVYQMKRQAVRQRERIEGNALLTSEQRRQAYVAIARETENSLTGLLGSEAFQQYRQSGGLWVDEIRQSEPDLDLFLEDLPGTMEETPQ